jgi:hypothetical protein
LIQLRSRQVAREQVTTYQEQEKAAVQERALNEAKATAAAQTALTQSLIQIKVHETTLSISNNRWYCLTSAFFGSTKMRLSVGSSTPPGTLLKIAVHCDDRGMTTRRFPAPWQVARRLRHL